MSDPTTDLGTAMTNMSAAWYNAICTNMKLDQSSFQLLAGEGLPLGEDIVAAWTIADIVPALALVAGDNSESRAVFSTNYSNLLGDLQDPAESQFQTAMGESYDLWVEYVKTYKWSAGDTEDNVFQTWAMQQGWAQNQINSLIGDMNYDEPVSLARSMVQAAEAANKGFAYEFTIDQITDALRTAPAVPIDVTLSSQNTSFDGTWAQGTAGAWWDIFGVESRSTYSATSLAVADAGLTISGQFDHVTTCAVLPLSEPSDDPILSTYAPWYDSSVLAKALDNQSNQDEIWNLSADGSWSDYFDPTTGQLARASVTMVVVDGLDFTIDSNVSVTNDQATQINSNTETGFFPFFAADGSITKDVTVQQADSSGLSVKVSRLPGAPLVLGLVVEPAQTYSS